MASHSDSSAPPALSLLALFLKFLRFGMFAFGGPVAQIAMVKAALVDEERWISPVRFNRLLAVMQALPGPEAHELCVHLGMIARGRWGGVLAGVAFMLPGLLLMLVAGLLYTRFVVDTPGFAAVLLGVQIVILAVVLRAVFRIGQHIIDSRLLAVIGIAAFGATLAGVPFWVPLVAGGVAYSLTSRLAIVATAVAAIAIAIALQSVVPATATTIAAGGPATVAALFVAGLKGGLLTFGGAYTAIPYVRSDTVGRGWLSDATFLDGVAISGLLPAPLVIFATFVGYVSGGLGGALAITAGMFLPAFAFSLIFFERLEAIVENPALHRLLAGVSAAVVGIIAATFVQLLTATGTRVANLPTAALLFASALVIVWRVKGALVIPGIVAGGALAGWLLPS